MFYSTVPARIMSPLAGRSRREVCMGWGIKLWDEWDRVRFTTKSADVFRNCLLNLKSHSHDTIVSITQELGCGPDTVVRVRRMCHKGGPPRWSR